MQWQLLKPPVPNHGSYFGIRVGHKCINFPKQTDDKLYERKWKFVKVEFNPETNQIRLSEGDRTNGYVYRFRRGQLAAKLSDLMALGRYQCHEERKDGFVFAKY